MANFNKLLEQAQKMQEQMQVKQKALGEKKITSTAGGDMITLVCDGHGNILDLTINPEATPGMSEDDREMLVALLTAAISDSQQKVRAESQAALGGGLGGFDLSGGLGDLFK